MKPARSLLILFPLLLSACVTAEQIVPQDLIVSATEPPAPIPSATPSPVPTIPPTNTGTSEPIVFGFPYAAVLNDSLPKENLVLARHFYADTVGHIDDTVCYDVAVYSDGSYTVVSCVDGFSYPAPNGVLDANQSRFLNRWMEQFQGFEEPSIHGVLVFKGMGSVIPEYADMVSMQAMIGDLEWTAHEYVHRGGYPPVIFQAREILSRQLNKWLDDSALRHFEAVDFPDACLGVPKPNEVCEQTITQGFLIQFVVDGLLYEFHTDVSGYDIRPFGEPQIAPQGAGG